LGFCAPDLFFFPFAFVSAYSLNEVEEKTREFRKNPAPLIPEDASTFKVSYTMRSSVTYCCLLVFV
jgi:hypothetical protein